MKIFTRAFIYWLELVIFNKENYHAQFFNSLSTFRSFYPNPWIKDWNFENGQWVEFDPIPF